LDFIMNLKFYLTAFVVLALGGAAAFYIARDDSGHHEETSSHDHGHGHDADESSDEAVKGPHNGRLLVEDDFTLELAIFEKGVPPEFRAWFSQGDKSIAPSEVQMTVKLTRQGNKIDIFNFSPVGDFAQGDKEVGEPHSFSYEIIAEHAGHTYRWAFDAPEMQTTINEEAARAAGMEVMEAGPAEIGESLFVYGQIRLNADKIARATPRFGGVILEARRSLGDTVKAGEVVAIVETNETLVSIEVKSPIDGVVVERSATAGETISGGNALYVMADFSDVWVELNIPKQDQAHVEIGQNVLIHADNGDEVVTGKIDWISPIGEVEAQTIIARVVLPNSDGRWRPGLFVKGEVTLEEELVAVAVKESGLQSLHDFTVVFSQHGELYQARPLELGRRSGGFVEVLKGIEAGERYVVENSFLVKADIGKTGASHDH
jgi:cobalt-zinc-cadmium efflux system membrane fusion protein